MRLSIYIPTLPKSFPPHCGRKWASDCYNNKKDFPEICINILVKCTFSISLSPSFYNLFYFLCMSWLLVLFLGFLPAFQTCHISSLSLSSSTLLHSYVCWFVPMSVPNMNMWRADVDNDHYADDVVMV